MPINIAIQSLLVIATVILQVSFLTTWPSPINGLNLVLSLVIFLVIIMDQKSALVWALVGGFLLELFSGLPFGATSISLLLTVLLTDFLFKNFFTNRSLYSLLILGYLGSVCYHLSSLTIITTILLISNQSFSLVYVGFFEMLFWRPFLNMIILTVIFYSYHLSTGKLHTAFINTNDHEKFFRG
jgi:cell shape-determining protein MreD